MWTETVMPRSKKGRQRKYKKTGEKAQLAKHLLCKQNPFLEHTHFTYVHTHILQVPFALISFSFTL